MSALIMEMNSKEVDGIYTRKKSICMYIHLNSGFGSRWKYTEAIKAGKQSKYVYVTTEPSIQSILIPLTILNSQNFVVIKPCVNSLHRLVYTSSEYTHEFVLCVLRIV